MADLQLKTTLVQLNSLVGDVAGNIRKITDAYAKADAAGADLVVTPELSVTGYPLEDLVNTGDMLTLVDVALDILRDATAGRRAALLVGAPVGTPDGVLNAAVVLAGGERVGIVGKRALLNQGVFDEKRNFVADTGPSVPVEIHGVKIGVMICEDSWTPDAARELAAGGARFLLGISASPFRPGILQTRVRDVAALRVSETGLPMILLNAVGGQDEIVFDGGSFVLDGKGRCVLQLPQWRECVADCGPALPDTPSAGPIFPDPMEEIWCAMVLGVGDYVRKSGFSDVVLGLSGGMDSAVVAAVAGDALGPERVHCLRLPSRHTTDLSSSAAENMCKLWGFSLDTIPIEPVIEAAVSSVPPGSPDGLGKLTLENMQARARGFLLMTVSNDRGWLLLSTGNKSEIAVGYSTLYGDMCGGYNPLKDVFKTTVYAVAKWRNANRPDGLLGPSGVVIPQEIIDRPPSAELSPGQLDSDSLPPYPVLDAILKEVVEKRTPVPAIIEKGYPPETVVRVYRMLKRAEYKRRQGAPGPMATRRAFSRDRRIPIVNGYDPGMLDGLKRSRGKGTGGDEAR